MIKIIIGFCVDFTYVCTKYSCIGNNYKNIKHLIKKYVMPTLKTIKNVIYKSKF